jgi:hypothetical protein
MIEVAELCIVAIKQFLGLLGFLAVGIELAGVRIVGFQRF